jgi:nucleotide-binding universal stress UspA family protein
MSDATPSPTPPASHGPGTIVVGVDGSEPSKDALRWAARQAELTGAELLAITAWHFPTTYWAVVPEGIDFAGEAGKALDKAIAEVLGDSPSVKVRTSVFNGSAAVALIDASADAELVVVGSRGHGAFSGMLIGSVSEHVVTQASCPVLVVRHPHHAS